MKKIFYDNINKAKEYINIANEIGVNKGEIIARVIIAIILCLGIVAIAVCVMSIFIPFAIVVCGVGLVFAVIKELCKIIVQQIRK